MPLKIRLKCLKNKCQNFPPLSDILGWVKGGGQGTGSDCGKGEGVAHHGGGYTNKAGVGVTREEEGGGDDSRDAGLGGRLRARERGGNGAGGGT